jgi:hypothetical protein
MKAYHRRPDCVAEAAWRRGYMTPLELFRVAAWKTGLGLGNLTLNSEDRIKRATLSAINGIRPWKGERVLGLDDDARWAAWRKTANAVIGVKKDGIGLLALDGVGYPMATAILDILDPELWPVMDRWATLTVFGRPLRWYGAAAYVVYTRHLATVGHACWPDKPSIHSLDEMAMETSRRAKPLPAGWTYATIPLA